MGSILCAMDFAETSPSVLKMAFSLSLKYEAHLTVLFSYRLLPQSVKQEIPKVKSELEEKVKEEFKKLELGLSNNGHTSYEFRSEIGFLPDRIESFVRKSNVQMIVVSQSLIATIQNQQEMDLNALMDAVRIPFVIVPNN